MSLSPPWFVEDSSAWLRLTALSALSDLVDQSGHNSLAGEAGKSNQATGSAATRDEGVPGRIPLCAPVSGVSHGPASMHMSMRSRARHPEAAAGILVRRGQTWDEGGSLDGALSRLSRQGQSPCLMQRGEGPCRVTLLGRQVSRPLSPSGEFRHHFGAARRSLEHVQASFG